MSNVRLRKRSKDNLEASDDVKLHSQPSSKMKPVKQLFGIFVLGFVGHYVKNAFFPPSPIS